MSSTIALSSEVLRIRRPSFKFMCELSEVMEELFPLPRFWVKKRTEEIWQSKQNYLTSFGQGLVPPLFQTQMESLDWFSVLQRTLIFKILLFLQKRLPKIALLLTYDLKLCMLKEQFPCLKFSDPIRQKCCSLKFIKRVLYDFQTISLVSF